METVLADPHVLQGVVVALFAVLLLVFVYALGQRSALKSLAAMQAVSLDVPARQNSQSCTIMQDAQHADPVPTAPDIATSCAIPPPAVSLAAGGEALPSAAAGGLAADGPAADGQPIRYVAGRAVRPDGTVVHLKRMHDQKSLRDLPWTACRVSSWQSTPTWQPVTSMKGRRANDEKLYKKRWVFTGPWTVPPSSFRGTFDWA